MASASSRAADDEVHLFAEASLTSAQQSASTAASFQQQHHLHHDYRLLDHPVNFDPVAGSSSSFYHYGAMNPAATSSSNVEEHNVATSSAVGMEGSEQYYYGTYIVEF